MQTKRILFSGAVPSLLLAIVCFLDIAGDVWSAGIPGIARLETLRGPVQVELFEKVQSSEEQGFTGEKTEVYSLPAFGFSRIPAKFSEDGLPLDRSTPFILRATWEGVLPPGLYEFRVRSKGKSFLRVNGRGVLETAAQIPNKSSHDALPEAALQDLTRPETRLLRAPHQEEKVFVEVGEERVSVEFVAWIGGKGLAPFPDELSVSYGRSFEPLRLLGGGSEFALTDEGWLRFVQNQEEVHALADRQRRREASQERNTAWREYHQRVAKWMGDEAVPEEAIDWWIDKRLGDAGQEPNEGVGDLEFLRRLVLDLTGRIPSHQEVERYLSNSPDQRRSKAIEQFLEDPGWADHWVSYWQDVLAENPGILKPDLNNSGPFRWFLHQSFEDNKPVDRWVAELVQMQGSVHGGGPAGFQVASLNDAPMAAKADVLAQAFLGEKLSCARCHDSPHHPHTQKNAFSLAAMLEGESVKLPESSTVKVVAGFREPRVKRSLVAGEEIHPAWPFQEMGEVSEVSGWMPLGSGAPVTRDEVARRLVSPSNERFALVLVNRVWKRYMGAGFVEPAEDWQDAECSHPELLAVLARDFVRHGFDLKHLVRRIVSSKAYAREGESFDLRRVEAGERLFAGPVRRRMSAEQLVDSLLACSGKEMACEELNLNPLGDRPVSQFLNMGYPKRAWEFTALMNERDRPSLALPAAQSVVDVLTTYGWRQSRMNPVTDRQDAPSAMQSLLLANGVFGSRIIRLTEDSWFTGLLLEDRSLEEVIEATFLRILTRQPTLGERKVVAELLEDSFKDRRVSGAIREEGRRYRADSRVSWANHFDDESTRIRLEEERRVRQGDEPTATLTSEFRERFEDFLWSLFNSPEFVVIP